VSDKPPAGPDPVASPGADPAQLGQIFHRVRAIGQRLDELGGRLGRVEESRAVPGAAQPGPAAAEPGLPEWSWVRLDPAERGRRLVELHQWVTWLVSTYAIPSGQLPDCWYQHSAMVADLGALHAGWAAAYLDPKAEPDRPSRWHDTLERTLRRLREWDRHGCGRSGRHAEQIVDMAAEHCSATDLFEQYVERQGDPNLSHPVTTVPGNP